VTPAHGQGARLGGLCRARGRGRRHATLVDPLARLSPRGGHPRVGQPVRSSESPPVPAACGPTSQENGIGRRLPRLMGFPRGHTWLPSFESWKTFGGTRVRVGARVRGGDHHCRTTGRWSSPCLETWSSRPDRTDTPGGRWHETADQYEPVGLRAARRYGDLTRRTGGGALPGMIRERPMRRLLVADVPYDTVDTMSPLYTTVYRYSPRGVTPDLPSCQSSWFTDAPIKAHRPRGRADLGGAAPAAPRGRRRGHAGAAGGGSRHRRPRWSRGEGPRGRYDGPLAGATPPLAGAECRRCHGPTARSIPRGRRRCSSRRPSRSPSSNREARRRRR